MNGHENGNGHRDPAKKLQLLLQETEDPWRDEMMLRDVLRLLLEYPGNDQVYLAVYSNGKTVQLEAEGTVDGCPELYEKLQEVLGEGMVQERLVP